jgi:hypothetical protein
MKMYTAKEMESITVEQAEQYYKKLHAENRKPNAYL